MLVIFIAGGFYTVASRGDQLTESQNTLAFVYGLAGCAAYAFVIALGGVFWGARMNKRLRDLAEGDHGAVVLNVDKRHGTGMHEGLVRLGGPAVARASIYAVLGNTSGISIYCGYAPPKLIVHVPQQNITSITKEHFVLGVRSIPRIGVRVRTAEGTVDLPLVPNQTGWGIFNFSSEERTDRLVRELNDLREGQA